MFKLIIHTLGNKVVSHIISFLIIVFTTNVFGQTGKGEISLFVFNVSLLVIISGFFGGPTLVYFFAKVSAKPLIVFSYIGNIFTVCVATTLLYFLNLIQNQWLIWFILVSILQGFAAINGFYLLGFQKVKLFNYLNLLQVISLLLILTLGYYVGLLTKPSGYILAYSISTFVYFMSTLFYVLKNNTTQLNRKRASLAEVLKLSFFNQIGNFFQMVNYRISFYFISSDVSLGTTSLGIFSTAVQIGEALWVISRSISMVQYSYITNQNDRNKSARLTLKMVKLNFVSTTVFFLPFILTPSSGYAWVFGNEFTDVKQAVFWLGLSIISNAVSGGFSHFYSGIGLQKVNAFFAGIGSLITVVLCFMLIPGYGIFGACLAHSLSFLIVAISQSFYFAYAEQLKFSDFLIGIDDINALKQNLLKYTK